ncbi:MAG: hypothetical protein Q8T08_11280, partial [Ignavibacteria bacterium]|nr:hypothetical protein [Ignavibacteria bacterium]
MKSSPLGRRLTILIGSPTPFGFLLGGTALGLLTNGLATAISAMVDKEKCLGGWITAIIGFVILVIALLFFELPETIRNIFKHPVFNMSEPVSCRRGLVAFVSPGPEGSPQTREAINYH